MKRVRIQEGMVGLVFKNGNFIRVITEGIYWLGFGSKVMTYDLSQEFFAPKALEVLLKNETLSEMLDVVHVEDQQLVMVFSQGNFYRLLTPGRYTFWNSLVDYEFKVLDLSDININKDIDKSILTHNVLRPYVRTFEVATFEKAVLIVDDVYERTLDSGTYYFWRNHQSIKIAKADLRQLQLEVAGQELLTKDKAMVRINFYAQYKVVDIETALLRNKDYEKQLYINLQLALRAYVGAYTLDELLAQKDEISKAILDEVKSQATKLGISVLNTGIRDVILPGDMKEIMNQVLIAQKKAQAHVITRREETASTRSLLNTAKLMEDNQMLFKLKEMEYVEKIADKIGEITLAGNGNVVEQLKDIFSVNK